MMQDICYCCFNDTPAADLHAATNTGKVSGVTVVQYVTVCTACRRLECEVRNPEGCKRPELYKAVCLPATMPIVI